MIKMRFTIDHIGGRYPVAGRGDIGEYRWHFVALLGAWKLGVGRNDKDASVTFGGARRMWFAGARYDGSDPMTIEEAERIIRESLSEFCAVHQLPPLGREAS
jgi:hypothetical protein